MEQHNNNTNNDTRPTTWLINYDPEVNTLETDDWGQLDFRRQYEIIAMDQDETVTETETNDQLDITKALAIDDAEEVTIHRDRGMAMPRPQTYNAEHGYARQSLHLGTLQT